MDFEVRAATDGDFDDVVRAIMASWGQHAVEDDLADARTAAELDRTFAAFDHRGQSIGGAAAISVEMTVPGGATVRGAALTGVGVLPTHRRRGVLSALLARHVEQSQARGEPVIALIAAQGAIYNRFGFGVATQSMAAEIDPRDAAFLSPLEVPGEMRLLGPDEAAVLLPEVYDRYRRGQPGEISRSGPVWEVALREAERDDRGSGALFAVAHEAPDGDVDGYATYRMGEAWLDGAPAFALRLEELVAPSPAVRASLWRFLLDVDLVRTVHCFNLAVDDPIRWLLADPRALHVTRVRDWLWIHLVDVAAALSARRYAVAGRVVLDVDGPGGGRFLLDGSPHGATCRPCPEQGPDVTIGLAALGAAYLGGVRFSTLARAGRVVEHTGGALARADALFSADPSPHCLTDF